MWEGLGVYVEEFVGGLGGEGLEVGVVKVGVDWDGVEGVYVVGNGRVGVDVGFVVDGDLGRLNEVLFWGVDFVEWRVEGGDIRRDILNGNVGGGD